MSASAPVQAWTRRLLGSRFLALLRKEVQEILRDRQLIKLLLIPPTLQLLVYGFALNPDVRFLPLGVVDHARVSASRELGLCPHREPGVPRRRPSPLRAGAGPPGGTRGAHGGAGDPPRLPPRPRRGTLGAGTGVHRWGGCQQRRPRQRLHQADPATLPPRWIGHHGPATAGDGGGALPLQPRAAQQLVLRAGGDGAGAHPDCLAGVGGGAGASRRTPAPWSSC